MTAEAERGTPTFFVGQQLTVMRGVLDRIIPPDDKFPGAGELGVADYMDLVVGESAELKSLFSHGLSQIEIVSKARFSKGFEELTGGQREAVLRQVESDAPKFFEELVRYTYYGYYADVRVLKLLGMEARPPQPKGYRLEPGDLSLIEKVKRRGRAYREV